jgi:hypothetical protein
MMDIETEAKPARRRREIPLHAHRNSVPRVVYQVQGALQWMVPPQGWFYAGRIGSELKIGISRGCAFCRMEQQYLEPLGLAYSDDCLKHESDMKRVLGQPSHGQEYFPDWEGRFAWLVKHRYIHDIHVLERGFAELLG